MKCSKDIFYEIYQNTDSGKWIYFEGRIKHHSHMSYDLEQAWKLEQMGGQDLVFEIYKFKRKLFSTAKRVTLYYHEDIDVVMTQLCQIIDKLS